MSNANKGAGMLVAVLVTLAIAGTGGYMLGNRTGQSAAQLDTAVVATVNGDKITKSDLYNRMVTESGTTVVKDLIREKLVDQEAAKAKVTVTAQDIDKEIEKIKKRIGGEEQFQAALAQSNLTMEQLRDIQSMRIKMTKILMPQIPQDEAALKAYFDTNKAQFDTRMVSAKHILVKEEAEAKAIKEQLDKGGDWNAIAKEKSIDTSNKDQGGDLKTFGPGEMVPEFDAVVFNMKKGETSAPFQTSFGWHIVNVTDVKGTAPNYDTLKAEITEAYIDSQVQERASAWLTEMEDKAKIDNTLAPKS